MKRKQASPGEGRRSVHVVLAIRHSALSVLGRKNEREEKFHLPGAAAADADADQSHAPVEYVLLPT